MAEKQGEAARKKISDYFRSLRDEDEKKKPEKEEEPESDKSDLSKSISKGLIRSRRKKRKDP